MSVSRKVQMGAGGGADPWSFENASYDVGTGNNNHLGAQDLYVENTSNALSTSLVGVDFKTDGTLVFLLLYNASTDDITVNSYTLSTAYDLTTAVFADFKTLTFNETVAPKSFRFSGDGTKLYYADRSTTNVVAQVSLGTAWDITSISGAPFNVNIGTSFQGAILFNNTGTVLYVIDNSTSDTIIPITLGTAWDLTGTLTQGTAITFTDSGFLTGFGTVTSMDLSHDGTVLYTFTSSNSGGIAAVEVGTAFDLSSIDDTNQSRRDDHSYRVEIPSNARVISDSSSVRVFSGFTGSSATKYNYNGFGIISSLADEGPDVSTNPNAFEWEYKSSVFAPQYDAGGGLNSIIYGSPSGGSTKNYLRSFWFNSDGTKLYTVYTYNTSDSLYVTENTLSTPYDVGSVSTLGTSAVYQTATDMFQIIFIDDGNKFCRFNAGYSGTIEVWTTSVPYDLTSSATKALFGEYVFANQVTSSPVIRRMFSDVNGIAFNDDGTKMYLSYGGNSTNLNNRVLAIALNSQVMEISLSTPWDPSTADFSEIPWIVHDQLNSDSDPNNAVGLEFKSDGSEFFTMGNERNYWWEHTPITSNNLVSIGNPLRSTGFLTTNTGLRASTVSSWQFKADGTRWFGFDNGNLKQIYQKDLATAWDAPSSLGDTANPTFASYPSNAVRRASTPPMQNVTFNPTGTKYYTLSTSQIFEYTLSTAWDLGTVSISPTHTLNLVTNGYTSSDFGDIVWGNNGFKLYQLGRYNSGLGSPFITEWTASVAYDLSSLGTTPYTASITPDAGSFPRSAGMRFKPDGTKIFISVYIGTTERIVEYTLSTAWNLSTINGTSPHAPANSTAISLSSNSQAITIEFNSTGTIMYLAQKTNLYYYNLSTAWDTTSISQTTADQIIPTLGWPSTGGDNSTIFITSDGTKYFRGSGEEDFVGKTFRFNFGTAYDWSTISPASSDKSFCFFNLTTFPATGGTGGRAIGGNVTEFRFSSDGSKLYTAEKFQSGFSYNNPDGNSSCGFSQYNLSTPWDVTTASYVAFKRVLTSDGSLANTDPITSFDISSDGSRIILSSISNRLDFYIGTMSTPYDITTLGTMTSFADANGGATAANKGLINSTGSCAIRFNSAGTTIYVRGDYTTDECSFVKIDLPSAYTLGPVDIKFPSGIGDGGSLSNIGVAVNDGTTLLSPVFGDNGYKFYVSAARSYYNSITLGLLGDDNFAAVNEYTLTSPYDLSTATFANTIDLLDPAKNWTQGVLDSGSLFLHWSSSGKTFYLSQGTQIGTYKV